MKGEYTSTSEGADGADGKVPLEISSGQVLSRTIPAAVLAQYTSKVRSMQQELAEHFRNEKMKANLDELQMEAERAENLLLHEQEIGSRPARTWYQTEKEKAESRDVSRGQVKTEQEVAQLGVTAAKQSAADRARALALPDDYPIDRAVKDKSHKMSRKKRRKMEALAEDQGEGSEDEHQKKGASGEYFVGIY